MEKIEYLFVGDEKYIIGCCECCHSCCGGWPGTKMHGKGMIDAAMECNLIPDRMGCGTLQRQAEFLVKLYGCK